MLRATPLRRDALRFVLAAVVVATMAGAARAEHVGWDGTWFGGWDKGNGVQLIFADNTFIGLLWRVDYLHDPHAEPTPDGKSVRITWPGAEAVLTRTGETTAQFLVRERGRPDVAVDLKRE